MPGQVVYHDEMEIQLEIRENVLNNLGMTIYVSDLATNEILFTNEPLRQMYGEERLTGKICWAALRNESKRCTFCKIPYLLKNPGKECYWEICRGDRRFQLYDNIIPWANGRLAHLQCIVEIVL